MVLNCRQVREHLSAFGDGALDAGLHETVVEHLMECADCRGVRDSLQSLDRALSSALEDRTDRVAAIAEQAVARWQAEPVILERSTSSTGGVLGYLAAAAAGFLLAVVLFQSRPVDQQPIVQTRTVEADNQSAGAGEPVVARIVSATGPLLFKHTAAAAWEPLPADQLTTFGCPADSCLKTDTHALCELQTTDGARLRLNENSEIALPAADEIELRNGQVWCQAPKNKELRMKAGADAARPMVWTCPTESEALASLRPEGEVLITAAAGVVNVTANDAHHSLAAGMTCSSKADEVLVRSSSDDFLVASRWMQPLLSQEGDKGPELNRRVDALLARIGRTKLSFLYEQDLRNLGEAGALPLLRFVQSANSAVDPERRQSAMRILADTAPVWMVPDLIRVLEDPDPEVRRLAAAALTRLTNNDQNLTADDWRGERSRWASGVAGWQAWWMQNSVSCSLPPTGARPKSGVPPEHSQLLKARNE